MAVDLGFEWPRIAPVSASASPVGGELVNFGVNRRYGAVLCRLAGVIISTHGRSAPPGDPSARYPREIPRPGRRAPGRSSVSLAQASTPDQQSLPTACA